MTKQTILAALVVLGLGAFWFTQYVAPKDATLLAASTCLQKQGYRPRDPSDPVTREAWGACLKKAEAKHATATLKAVGY